MDRGPEMHRGSLIIPGMPWGTRDKRLRPSLQRKAKIVYIQGLRLSVHPGILREGVEGGLLLATALVIGVVDVVVVQEDPGVILDPGPDQSHVDTEDQGVDLDLVRTGDPGDLGLVLGELREEETLGAIVVGREGLDLIFHVEDIETVLETVKEVERILETEDM